MDEEENGDLNTRDDFLDSLRKDYNKGIQIPQEYQSGVFQYAIKKKKNLLNLIRNLKKMKTKIMIKKIWFQGRRIKIQDLMIKNKTNDFFL